MSTSIENKDLLTVVKDLQKRISDMERQQQSMTGEIIANSGNIAGVLTVGGDTSVIIDGPNGRITVKNGSLSSIIIGNI